MAQRTLHYKEITTPIAATTRFILVKSQDELPDPVTLMPIRAVNTETGDVYILRGSWVLADFEDI